MTPEAAGSRSVEWVAGRRLVTQRLTSGPLPRAADAVRLLLAVQAQDAPLAAWSVGMRSRAGTYAAVRAEQDTGAFVRTHVLRPTWHLVAAEDLRWLLALTSPRIEAGLAARHRQLELDARTVDAAIEALAKLLEGGRTLTRKQTGPLLAEQGHPGPGPRLAHLLLLAELRGVVCSGPHAGREHTYALLEERLPPDPAPPADRDEALGRLVTRFFQGHGPAGVGDLVRWAAVNRGEVARGLEVAGDALEAARVAGEEQWFDPGTPPRAAVGGRAAGLLLPTFDEAVLSYLRSPFPRPASHVLGVQRLSPASVGGGAVVVAGVDVGTWKRVASRRGVTVRARLAAGLPSTEVSAVEAAAVRLADFVELPLELTLESCPSSSTGD